MTADEILAKFNEFLEHLPYDRKPFSLYEPVKYVLSLGGKRIRPTLMLLAYNLYKDDPESILMPACALETYHNYTLLHDDLMDNADLRRGHMTAVGTPTPPYSAATPCWCSPISAWPSAVATSWQRCFSSSPRRLWR